MEKAIIIKVVLSLLIVLILFGIVVINLFEDASDEESSISGAAEHGQLSSVYQRPLDSARSVEGILRAEAEARSLQAQ